MKAVVRIREQPHYRREAFVSGLARAGYDVVETARAQPADVLVLWNRIAPFASDADQWERDGGTVLVAENGYIGQDGNGIQYYSLAVGGHNGSGRWPNGDGKRFEQLGIEVQPWRKLGGQIIVRGQRGIGTADMASPHGWHDRTASHLSRTSTRPLVIQQHSGKPACDAGVQAMLSDSLRGAHAMCIWSSAAGVRALVDGVPVFYDAPHWICEGAAVRGYDDIEHPRMDDADRIAALQRMAWAQWSVAEIADGEPFMRLREV